MSNPASGVHSLLPTSLTTRRTIPSSEPPARHNYPQRASTRLLSACRPHLQQASLAPTQPHAHLDRQVWAVHLVVQLLCLIKALEVDRHLRELLGLHIQLRQVLHKLDALHSSRGGGVAWQ